MQEILIDPQIASQSTLKPEADEIMPDTEPEGLFRSPAVKQRQN
jgi:hypothetical protein